MEVSFPLADGLSDAQMQTLGLYISVSRSEQETTIIIRFEVRWIIEPVVGGFAPVIVASHADE